MRADSGAAGNRRNRAGQIHGGQLTDTRERRHNACRHGHRHCRRADADPYQNRHDEGQKNERHIQGGDCIADHVAQSGVLKHIPQDAAAGRHQNCYIFFHRGCQHGYYKPS